MEEPSQFSVDQRAQSLTCQFHNGETTLNDGLRMLLSCFRKMMSAVLLLVQLPLLADLLLGGHDVVDVVDGERGHDGVEAPQVRVLGRAEAAGEDLDQELEVLRALGEVLAQVLHDLVNVRVDYSF